MPNQVVGLTSHGQPDGDDPIKIGGVARTTNPTAVNDSARVNATYDKIGRAITYPYHIRDMIVTASSVVTRNDETEIMTGVAATYLDLVTVTMANTSVNAINLALRSGRSAGTALSLTAPASTNSVVKLDPPFPATELAAAWTASATSVAADSGDSPVTVTLIAIKNI